MKQTEKVSIGGYSFILERDAYERLNGYIEDVRSTYQDNSYAPEILSDIEQRIAELFIEKGGKECIVSYAMVDAVIRRIGSPAELADEEKAESGIQDHTGTDRHEAKRGAAFPDGPKRLYRDIDHRILGGVCSGIAAYFHIDVVIPRLIFCGIVFLVGFFISLSPYRYFSAGLLNSAVFCLIGYAVLWLIIPAAKTVEEKCRMRGEPIDLKHFTEKFEKFPVKETVEEMKSAPALHAVGRVVSIVIGIFLIITGIGSLLGCTMYDLVRDLIIREAGTGHIGYYSDDEIIVSQFLMHPQFMWIIIGCVALFSIWLIYNGVLMTFNLRSPRWRPGTVIFILWIVSLLVLAAWVIRRLLIIETLL